MGTRTPTRPRHEQPAPPRPDGGAGRSIVKLVTVVLPPHGLETLQDVVAGVGVPGMTVSEVGGFGRQRGHGATYRGVEYDTSFVPKLKVEMLVPAPDVERLVDSLVEAVDGGPIGSGKVWVTPVTSVTRIRTGEHGHDAI